MTKLAFAEYIKRFPEIELPVTLTEEAVTVFSKNNQPLSEKMVALFIANSDQNADEFTEYVPCFRIAEIEKYIAVVYWKAGLMTYEYILVCYDLKGNLLDKKIIAGTKVEGDALARTVATIDKEKSIFIVGGITSAHQEEYDPTNTQSLQFQLMENGQIVSLN